MLGRGFLKLEVRQPAVTAHIRQSARDLSVVAKQHAFKGDVSATI